MKRSEITSSPNVLGGVTVFRGARVPVHNLIDYLEEGERVDDFLADFPTVSRQQVIAVLEQAKEVLVHAAAST